jgi:hypothetical protein
MSHIGQGRVWLAFSTLVGCILDIKVQGGWATKMQFQEIRSLDGAEKF